MSSLYRPKYRASDGALKESSRDLAEVPRRTRRPASESSETAKEQEARRLLKQREGAAVEGRVVIPRSDKITVTELAQALRDGYTTNGRKSSERLELSLAHLLPVFGTRRAVHVTSADVTGYSAKRLEEGAAAATVNRELSALKRAFSLAVKGERLQRIPYIAMLRENNVRTGFVEPPQLEAIQRHLPDYAKAPILFWYITGGGSVPKPCSSNGDRSTSGPEW
jgi:hypothetical protein